MSTGFQVKSINDFYSANQMQNYRFVESDENNIRFPKFKDAFERARPFMELISLYEQNDNQKFWEKFNDISGKNYDVEKMPSPRMTYFNSFTEAYEDLDNSKEASLFMELTTESNGVRTYHLYLKVECMKPMDGNILFAIRMLAANDGSVFEKVLEVIYHRRTDSGVLGFNENPRGINGDPVLATMFEFFMHPKAGLQNTASHLRRSKLGAIRNDMYENLDIYALCDDYIESDENMLILSGPPGTGKTTVIKALITRMWEKFNKANIEANEQDGDMYDDVMVLYVKDVKVLEASEFWSLLAMKSEKYHILVFDDVDIVLQNRVGKDKEGKEKKTDFAGIVEQMLSLSNGFIKHDTKILVTTNLSIANIDPAIMRPGRCYDVLDMPKMSRAHARRLWTTSFELQDKDFPFEETVQQITQAALMSEVARFKRQPKRYFLNGANYSVRDKA